MLPQSLHDLRAWQLWCLLSACDSRSFTCRKSYLFLSAQLCEGLAEVEGLLETSAGLALRRRIAAVNIAIVCRSNFFCAFLSRCFLLGRSRFLRATSGPTSGKTVLLSLQLGGETCIRIFNRRRTLDFLLGGFRSYRGIGVAVARRSVRSRSLSRRSARLGGWFLRINAGDGIKSLLDELLDCLLREVRTASPIPVPDDTHTFCSLRSVPPKDDSRPCRIFFLVIVSRSAVARIPSMILV